MVYFQTYKGIKIYTYPTCPRRKPRGHHRILCAKNRAMFTAELPGLGEIRKKGQYSMRAAIDAKMGGA